MLEAYEHTWYMHCKNVYVWMHDFKHYEVQEESQALVV